MHTNTKSPVLKQLGGAVLGIAVATGIYFAMSWNSFANIQGYLINGLNTVHPNQVRVSDKTIDDRTLARISNRAKEISAAIGEGDQIHAAASSSVGTRRRSGSRAGLRSAAPGQEVLKPGAPLLETEEMPESKNLPDSGAGIYFFIVVSLFAVVLWMRPDRKYLS